MKAHGHIKSRGPTRINPQQVAFDHKRKVVLALNKLADRDTYQIAVDELEKTAECLTPDGVAPFLHSIMGTDSEQKSAVRKECIRLMGTLARFHEDLVGPHLGKMMSSIVKRLKDPDSVVRDACVETAGILASKFSNYESENGGGFVVLVKPLFEALGEQNKQVQSGSALCLARVIDNTNDPPVSILQQMLTKTTKLLKNPHFMSKPAVIELNRSIIQAGGAPTQNALSAAMVSIQEALKNSDWTTRKAASVALAEIALGGGALLGSFKASCIHSLESCRFDKVKPVRDNVMQALHNWRVSSGSDTPDPSEVGSSIKENYFGGDYNDLASTSDSGRRDVVLKVAGTDPNKRKDPLSIRKICQDYTGNNQHSRADDWHVEIAVPKTHNVSSADFRNDESESSSVTKTLERMSTDVTVTQDNGYEYVPMDDKQECSSVYDSVIDGFETKFVSISHAHLRKGESLKPMQRGQQFAPEEVCNEEQIYTTKTRDRRSLDSTVTESSSQPASGCCLQMANEMHCIRKQLLEIETKQSALMDLLQMFTSSTMDSFSMIQSKVLSLEHVIDKIAEGHSGRYSSDSAISKLMKHGYNTASPRISINTPRSSVDICSRPPSISAKNSDNIEQRTYGRSRSDNSAKEGIDMWTSSTVKTSGNRTSKDIEKSTGLGRQNTGSGQLRKPNNTVPASKFTVNARQSGSESKNRLWQCVKGFLSDGDFDSAYVEALCSDDELIFVELLDRTGPVLESLSPKTMGEVLSTVVTFFLEQRYVNSIIPWLQQVADLSSIHGPNYLALSAKARREIVSAIHEATNMEFSNPSERRTVTELAVRLRQMWGSAPEYQLTRRTDGNGQGFTGSK